MGTQSKKTIAFEVKGTRIEGGKNKPFTKIVKAFSENNARERTFALFGSKNKTKRRNISIGTVKPTREE
jgi:ribosomal protein L20A (L18A)